MKKEKDDHLIARATTTPLAFTTPTVTYDTIKSRCLIISDLDKTLLNDKSELSKTTISIVKSLVEAGHYFVISTGRPLRASINFYEQLGLNTLIVNYNGANISFPSDPEFIDVAFTFKKDLIISLLSDQKIKGLIRNALIENNNGSYFVSKPKNPRDEELLLEHFHVDRNMKMQYLKKDFSNLHGDIIAVLIQLKDQNKIDDLVYNIKSLTSTLITRTWSIPSLGQILEMNTVFSTKGTALKFLSSYYGIPLDRCFTFGDGDNDAEMLSKANFGFAMRNGSTIAKMSAKFLTKHTNQDNGVAHELKKIFKLKNLLQKIKKEEKKVDQHIDKQESEIESVK